MNKSKEDSIFSLSIVLGMIAVVIVLFTLWD